MARESRNTSNKTASIGRPPVVQRVVREVAIIALLTVVVYLLACLASYSPQDPAWSHATSDPAKLHNIGGKVGAYLADVTFWFFGYLAYAFPLLLLGVGWALFRDREEESESALEPALRLIGGVSFFIAGCGLAYLHFGARGDLPAKAGGILGMAIGDPLWRGFSFPGATLFLLALFLIAVTLATGLSWFKLMDAIGRGIFSVLDWLGSSAKKVEDVRVARAARVEREEVRKVEIVKQTKREPVKIEARDTTPIERSKRAEAEAQIPLFAGGANQELPPMSLLDLPKQQVKGYSEETLEALSRQVEFKLKDFRIDAQVVGVYPGPVITRFELQPAPGIKGSQISNLDKDIARGLSVISVRVVDVIPGKSVIGLEIPNVAKEIVYLSEILSSERYDAMKSPVALALGKDIGGRPVVADLAKMPHLLVAGTTGSGKSVAVNAMVLSLLYKATAKEVRLLMVDPKMLELSVYEGIPHLLTPVITDMKDAANGLRWCVAEMERRYKLMSMVGVRNLAGFNKKVKDAADAGQPMLDPLFVPKPDLMPNAVAQPLEPLPFIVIIIDEFADMIMIVGKKVEELIARLVHRAHIAGIHMIVTTARPNAESLTAICEPYIKSRLVFHLPEKKEFSAIATEMRTESLLETGDALFVESGASIPSRVHVPMCSDDEVHRVVEHLRAQGKYIDGAVNDVQSLGDDGKVVGESGLSEDVEDGEGREYDKLYDKAVAIVIESRRVSISGVQRRLKIGYNLAARLIEMMEQQGIVSAPQHNGNREVLAPPPPEL